jgi:hypothetical protein
MGGSGRGAKEAVLPLLSHKYLASSSEEVHAL